MKEKKTYLQPATEVLSVAAMLMNSYEANGSGIFDSGEGDDRSPIWDE